MALKYSDRNAEKGSAIVYVFIGIALFGSLMFLFARGASQNSSGLTPQQAKIVAAQVVNFADHVAKRVEKLLINQCSESEIDFYAPPHINANPLAKADETCRVFPVSSQYTDLKVMGASQNTPYWTGYEWFFSSYLMGVIGVGADTHVDLTVQAPNIKREVCLEINNILGIKNANGDPPRSPAVHGGGGYEGVLHPGNGRVINPVGNPLYGKDTGCYVGSASDGQDHYYYYKVLVPH